jgi:putative oxidoreductase
MEVGEIVITLLRVWLGVVILAHGVNHVRSIDGTARWFGSKGFRHARAQATFSAFGEIGLGVLFILGFLTSFAAAGLIAIMSVAFWSIHRFAGFFVFRRPDEGYEYVATVALVALAVAVLGPGPASVDAAVGLADVFDGLAGGGIALLGIVAAAGQLALFWRSPKAD